MRTENHPRPSRLLRVREFTEQVSKKADKSSTTTNRKSRFVAPYYFSDEDQSSIRGILAEHDIGDPEGVQLFITAAEYEVGGLRPALLEEPTQGSSAPRPERLSKADIELVQLGQSAAQLHALLQSTHETARTRLVETLTASDPFSREYGHGYLAQLELELERIARTCTQAEIQEESAEPAPPAPPSPRATKLIQQLARIYRECLDVPPNGEGYGPFCRILCIIRASADIDITCDAEAVSRLLS